MPQSQVSVLTSGLHEVRSVFDPMASYKVGERIWLQAREDAKARLGSDFDLKSFHRAALDLDSLGLAPQRAALGAS